MRFLVTIVLFLSLFGGAQAQNIKAQKEKRAKLEREIAIIDKQLAENASKSTDMLANLSLTFLVMYELIFLTFASLCR